MPLHVSRSFYLSPQDDCRTPLLEAIAAARSSVHVMIYALTLPELVAALVSAHARGLDVQVVADATQAAHTYELAALKTLVGAGIPVVLSESTEHALVHQKVVILDDEVAGYGSYNWSTNAARQDNVLVIEHEPLVAALFEAQFQQTKAWGLAHVPQLNSPAGPV